MISTFITGDAVDVFPFTVFSQIFVGLANRSDSHLLHFNPHLEVFERYQVLIIITVINKNASLVFERYRVLIIITVINKKVSLVFERYQVLIIRY